MSCDTCGGAQDHLEYLAQALRGMLRYGEHEGPCTNACTCPPEEKKKRLGHGACLKHLNATEGRKKVAQGALDRYYAAFPGADPLLKKERKKYA